jgi:hypothetical protein
MVDLAPLLQQRPLCAKAMRGQLLGMPRVVHGFHQGIKTYNFNDNVAYDFPSKRTALPSLLSQSKKQNRHVLLVVCIAVLTLARS